jgi:hypothetical protein
MLRARYFAISIITTVIGLTVLIPVECRPQCIANGSRIIPTINTIHKEKKKQKEKINSNNKVPFGRKTKTRQRQRQRQKAVE